MAKKSVRLLILGGGTGGISVAARMRKHLGAGSIAIVEPSETHYYQPLWSIVGAGLADREQTAKPQASLIPDGVEWIRDFVESLAPEQNLVRLKSGDEIIYEFLVVATGLRLAWEQIQGLQGNLGQNCICSVYEFHQVNKAAEMIQSFKGGTAIFTMPPVPIKCAGAPQKVMYLADDVFRDKGVREKSRVIFATAGKAMFGVPVFSKELDKVVARRGIEPMFGMKLVAVDAQKKIATFAGADGAQNQLGFDLLHVVPPMCAHDFIQKSPLANADGDQKGWLAVDKHTLQSLKFANVFGIGDVTGVPNSKTGAAIRKQAPIVVGNMLEVMKGQKPSGQYDGYASCPLITGKGKVMLAEFGYDGKLMPSFPFDQAVERRSMWILKKHVLPVLYWQGMMKGRA